MHNSIAVSKEIETMAEIWFHKHKYHPTANVSLQQKPFYSGHIYVRKFTKYLWYPLKFIVIIKYHNGLDKSTH